MDRQPSAAGTWPVPALYRGNQACSGRVGLNVGAYRYSLYALRAIKGVTHGAPTRDRGRSSPASSLRTERGGQGRLAYKTLACKPSFQW